MSLCWELVVGPPLPAASPPVPSPSLPPPRPTRWGAPPSSDGDGGSARVPKSSKKDKLPPPQRTRWGSVTPPSSDDGEPFPSVKPPTRLPGRPIVEPPTPPSDDGGGPVPPRKPTVIPFVPMRDAIEPVREIVTKLLDGMQRIESLCYSTYRIRNPPVLPPDSRERPEKPPGDDNGEPARPLPEWNPRFDDFGDDLTIEKWRKVVVDFRKRGKSAATSELVAHLRALMLFSVQFVRNHISFLGVLIYYFDGKPGRGVLTADSLRAQVNHFSAVESEWSRLAELRDIVDYYSGFLVEAYNESRDIVKGLHEYLRMFDDGIGSIPGFKIYKSALTQQYMRGDLLKNYFFNEYHLLGSAGTSAVLCLSLNHLSAVEGISPSIRFTTFQDSVVKILRGCLEEWENYNPVDFYGDDQSPDPPDDDEPAGGGWEVVTARRPFVSEEMRIEVLVAENRVIRDLIKNLNDDFRRSPEAPGMNDVLRLVIEQTALLDRQVAEERMLRNLLTERRRVESLPGTNEQKKESWTLYYENALDNSRQDYHRVEMQIQQLSKTLDSPGHDEHLIETLRHELSRLQSDLPDIRERVFFFERKLRDLLSPGGASEDRSRGGFKEIKLAITNGLRVVDDSESSASEVCRAESRIEDQLSRLESIDEVEADEADVSEIRSFTQHCMSVRRALDLELLELQIAQRRLENIDGREDQSAEIRDLIRELSARTKSNLDQLSELEKMLDGALNRQLTLERDPILYKAWLDATLDQGRRA